MELWDVYDENRNLMEEVTVKGVQLPPNKYHLTAECVIITGDNKILITKRAPEKHHPNTWECTTGSMMAGEDSLTGILREIHEETGLTLRPEQLFFINTETTLSAHRDTYAVYLEDLRLSKIVLQPGETVGAELVSIETIESLMQNDMFNTAQYARIVPLFPAMVEICRGEPVKAHPVEKKKRKATEAPCKATTKEGQENATKIKKKEHKVITGNPCVAAPYIVNNDGAGGKDDT